MTAVKRKKYNKGKYSLKGSVRKRKKKLNNLFNKLMGV